MIIKLTKNELTEKLSLASRFTSNKLTSATALQGVLIQGKGKELHIYSTNLSTWFHTVSQVEVKQEFKTIIEPKKVLEFLNFLPPGDVELEIKEKQVTIKQGKTKGNFPIIISDDFPLPPEISAEKTQTIDGKFFTENMPRILFSASRDDARPVLTGVNFVPGEDELLIVTTDGFRLSLLKDKKLKDIPSMIVPAEFLQEILRGAKDAKKLSFAFSPDEKLVSFQLDDSTYYSRLIDGEFPPFERVIPADTKTTVTIDRSEFLRNIKLISVFARDYSNVVVCEFANGTLTIKPKKEGNEENTAVMDVQMEGEPQKVAFNFRYVTEFLNTVDGDSIVMEILRSEAPIALKTPGNTAYLHIIMPVRIQE